MHAKTVFLYCSGGNVEVQSVTEASLHVATGSGNLKLGRIRASTVDLEIDGEVSCQPQTSARAVKHALCRVSLYFAEDSSHYSA